MSKRRIARNLTRPLAASVILLSLRYLWLGCDEDGGLGGNGVDNATATTAYYHTQRRESFYSASGSVHPRMKTSVLIERSLSPRARYS